MADRMIPLAVITGAHGVAGEVKLKLFGEGPDSLKAFKTLQAGARMLTLSKVRPANHGAVARFAEITDRTAAEALRGTELAVPRSALPPLADDEYYHADLIGLICETPDGVPIGTIVTVENYGAGDIIEIERPGEAGRPGKRFMVPMHKDAVPEWDDSRAIVDPAWIDS